MRAGSDAQRGATASAHYAQMRVAAGQTMLSRANGGSLSRDFIPGSWIESDTVGDVLAGVARRW